MKKSGATPLMLQHKQIKSKFPDAILLFRVGDFYETFGDDAIKTANILGIALTKRNNADPNAQALAGFPHHALDTYLHRLVKAGYRVAICDQLEDPKQVKGLVRRGVTEVVTPGVTLDDKLLDKSQNNFLCALHEVDGKFGSAFMDISTGDFFVAEGDEEYIDKLIQSLKPSEIIVAKPYLKKFKEIFGVHHFSYTLDTWIFELAYTYEKLIKHFQTSSLKGFGIEEDHKCIIAAGVIIHYLNETEHIHLKQLSTIKRINREEHLWMDKFTIRNLELLQNNNSNTDSSLIKIIDSTVSPMGARLLRRWLLFPLNNISLINARLNCVEYLIMHQEIRDFLKSHFIQIGDLERFVSKISLRKINPREVKNIAKGLKITGQIKEHCQHIGNDLIMRLCDAINPCSFISNKIDDIISDTPPIQINKGDLIKQNNNAELDELKDLLHNTKNKLTALQQQEISNTQIASLKISYNNIFGYYLEVPNTRKNKVPATWIRKQTLANAERYITPELKIFEEKILNAEQRIIQIEENIYNDLIIELQDYIKAIQLNTQTIAQLDCLNTFAFNAINFKYAKPTIADGHNLFIEDGRHPVIEHNLKLNEIYISNSINIDVNKNQINILTGPNMSGKSAILRQTALTIILAHIGSFVPCKSAVIPLTDKIFTRVGASDNISSGESTFMVEMNETASILNNISERSLVLLDEIGRGTSTYDGISIAWSIVEYLHNHPTIKAKVFFATHYHELNDLEFYLERVKNYHISYTEIDNKVIFLRKLTKGGAKHSFGIHVARMAGFPPSIIQRAEVILKELENKHVNNSKSNTPIIRIIDDKNDLFK